MGERKPSSNDAGGDEHGSNSNVVLVVLFAAVVGIGIWLVNSLLDARKIDDCISQGRRNCGPAIDVPPR
jgi:hypothetical protein